jgi:Flp pilus assembly protein TadG
MRQRRRGQALVEFALVAPVFFLLLFGIIEGGRFIFYYQVLNNATREGARYAIVHGSRSSCPSGPMEAGIPAPACYDASGAKVIQTVRNTAFGTLGSAVAVTPTWPTDNARDSDITVAATYTYRSLIPLLPLPPITITAESTLVINH